MNAGPITTLTLITRRPIETTMKVCGKLLRGSFRSRPHEIDDLCRSWSPAATQATQPAVCLPATEEDVPVLLDAKAAPETGAAFDGEAQLAAQRVGDLFGRLLEAAGAAIVNHDGRVQITRLLAGGLLSVIGGLLYK